MNQSLRLRPVGKRLLVEVIDDPNINYQTENRLFVPEHFLDLPIMGVVRGIGKRCEEFNGQIGDIVSFDKIVGNTIPGFDSFLVIHEKNIQGIYASKD